MKKKLKTPICRVCSSPIVTPPVLTYYNMPRAAQHFPNAKDLVADKGSDLSLFECAECGLLQLTCKPVSYYREVIRASAFSSEMRIFRVNQLGKWVKKYGLNNKRILEVGCGKGEYLNLFSGFNVNAVGLEFRSSALTYCKRNNLNALQGFLDKPTQQLPVHHFDGFVTFNFMEHWPKPVHTLRAIRNNLLPNGIGLIEVPNFNMILKESLYSEFISDHLSYFTTETLIFTLQSAGFEVLEIQSIWYDYILSATVRKRKQIDLSPLLRKQEKIRQELNEFITAFPLKSIAIWGAGHQALATLALSDLGGSIRYIIDSATFKQGKFTPSTHFPVVSPEHLSVDPVNAIIVMAAGYSDEVVRFIREHLKLKIPVSILRASGLESV